ncbi:hypothetical protein D9M70_570030 [compost metagenome]
MTASCSSADLCLCTSLNSRANFNTLLITCGLPKFTSMLQLRTRGSSTYHTGSPPPLHGRQSSTWWKVGATAWYAVAGSQGTSCFCARWYCGWQHMRRKDRVELTEGREPRVT